METPSLKYFRLLDYNCSSHYYLVETMPNLIAAYLDVNLPDIKSLIASITFVKRLAICSEVIIFPLSINLYIFNHFGNNLDIVRRLCMMKVVSSTSLNIWSYMSMQGAFSESTCPATQRFFYLTKPRHFLHGCKFVCLFIKLIFIFCMILV